jgi:outer membrane lipoprotein-sorting protein
MREAGQTLRVILLRAVLAATVLTAGAGLGLADDAKPKDQGKAVGGSNWGANTTGDKPSAPGSIALDPKQTEAISAINAYFNGINEMRGKFLQTDAEQKQQKGEFYIKRPGKFRFVYGSPSQLVILSDGETLSFEDYDLKHADRYPVDSTPFRLLLAKDVNLTRDADIKELTATDDLVTMTLQDKATDNQGQIQLFFVKTANQLELKEWVINGPQGDNTRVEIANIIRDKPADPKFFENAPLELETVKGKH